MNGIKAPPAAAAHVPQRVSGGAHSATGPRRKDNQDAFGQPPAGANQARYGTLYIVADGVGGRPGGAEASRAAVHYLQALFYAPSGPAEIGARLRACVQAVNALSRGAHPQPNSRNCPLTTLIAAVAHNERVWIANVGDSRAFLARGGGRQLQRLTEDHSEAMLLHPSGVPAQAGVPVPDAPTLRRTRALTRAIGLEADCQADIYAYTWEPGDRIILCSDGLASVPEPVVLQIALDNPPAKAARMLVDEALRRDGSDNATAVVMGYESAPIRRTARRQRHRAQLGVLTTTAIVFGVLLGWLTAAVFLYLSGGL